MDREQIIEHYKRLVEYLGVVCGPAYEFILHDVSQPDHSVVAIANSEISGRKVGAPLTEYSLELIKAKQYLTHKYVANYDGITETGDILRSSTFFIKDENEELIALLCINFNVSELNAVCRQIARIGNVPIPPKCSKQCFRYEEDISEPRESFSQDLPNLIRKILDAVLNDKKDHSQFFTTDEKMALLEILEKKGIFQLKGSVHEVAKSLHCSVPTIYRYLKLIAERKHGAEGR